MIIKLSKSFLKELKRCPAHIQASVIEILEGLTNETSLHNVNNIKKLQGFDNFYRIRVGNYRIGLELDDDEITVYVITVLPRGDMYKKFP